MTMEMGFLAASGRFVYEAGGPIFTLGRDTLVSMAKHTDSCLRQSSTATRSKDKNKLHAA